MTNRPMSREKTIEAWLWDNPGWHRPAEVGEALGYTAHQAARALYQLQATGRVRRHVGEGRSRGIYAKLGTRAPA
jgi:DNA-binding MarR family transcriptional regulator